jgi:hypothetical protein
MPENLQTLFIAPADRFDRAIIVEGIAKVHEVAVYPGGDDRVLRAGYETLKRLTGGNAAREPEALAALHVNPYLVHDPSLEWKEKEKASEPRRSDAFQKILCSASHDSRWAHRMPDERW